jgi:hypothetical protein
VLPEEPGPPTRSRGQMFPSVTPKPVVNDSPRLLTAVPIRAGSVSSLSRKMGTSPFRFGQTDKVITEPHKGARKKSRRRRLHVYGVLQPVVTTQPQRRPSPTIQRRGEHKLVGDGETLSPGAVSNPKGE